MKYHQILKVAIRSRFVRICVAGVIALTATQGAIAENKAILIKPGEVAKGQEGSLPTEIVISGSGVERTFEAISVKGNSVKGGL